MKLHSSFLIVFLIFVAISPVFSFDGFTDDEGSHTEMTQQALFQIYGKTTASVVKDSTVPLYGLHLYKLDNPGFADLFAYAARDVDIYQFGVLYTHAQTAEYDYDTQLSETDLRRMELDALFAYLQFVQQTIKRAVELLENGDDIQGLYLLGYIFHAFQDIYSHKGITNHQHVWLGKYHKNVDSDPDNIALCRMMTDRYLRALPLLLGEKAGSRFEELLAGDEVVKIPDSKMKKEYLGRGPDIWLEGVLFILINPHQSCMRYYREISWDYKALTDLLCSPTFLPDMEMVIDSAGCNQLLQQYGYDFSVNYVYPDLIIPEE